MSHSRDKLIDEIFSGALDRAGSERDNFLDDQCGDDAELKREVQLLLRKSVAPGDELANTLNEARDRLLRSVFEGDPEDGEDLSGLSTNNWRLENRIARGGLATVYIAHRDDGEFDQKAAFKVLRRGLDTDDLIARFRAERQILSTLEHPSIAQILDGGALDDGRPYLVLEFVDGSPITTYCDENRLSVRDKVVLMVRVLRALHHAHTHLVVHRDVKPSNILVSTEGHVSLLDFGIAKLLDPTSMSGASPITRTGVSLLTPGYASPEQHAGKAVTTSSDIYQAGAVLYEMLTGQRPAGPQADAQDTVSLRPSEALRGKPEFKEVSGDLDAIIHKATRSDPVQRYASADEMVSDLQRYLDGLPVIAQPDTAAYRISKLARRRPWLIPAVALVALSIAAYIATITIYSQRLAHEERIAAASQQFLVDLFQSSDPLAPADHEHGSSITVVEALGIGRQRIDDELSNQPELKATLLRAISEVYDSLDQDQSAQELREQALGLERQLFGEQSPEVIASLQALGSMNSSMGRPEIAGAMIQQQLDLARQVFASNSAELGLAEAVAGIHANGAGRVTEGRELLESGIAKLRPQRAKYARELIRSLIVYSDIRGMNVPEDAFPPIVEAEEIAKEVFGETSLQTAHTQIRIASKMTAMGDYRESEVKFKEALPVLEQRLGKEHGYSLSALNNLGYLYARSGEQEKAEAIHRELLDRHIRVFGPVNRSVANSYQNLGGALSKLGRFEEAVPLHRKAYDVYKEVLNDDNYMIAFPLLSMAYAELEQDRPLQAEVAATEALQRFEATMPGTFLEGVARCLLGLSFEMRGETEKGSTMVNASHELMQGASVPDPYPALCRLPTS